MKSELLLCLALVLGGGLAAARADETIANPAPSTHSLQRQLEQLAQTNKYFSLTVIIRERPLRLWPSMDEMKFETNGSMVRYLGGTNALAAEQWHLLAELRALSGNREELAALLTNSDPKVRTLALGSLFQREDGRDLPLIASLINDSAQTFPNLHESMSQQAGPRPIAQLTNSQSVSNVVQAMLSFWMRGQRGFENSIITSNDFAAYWARYAGRSNAASWFAVKMKRATRQTTPIQPEYQAKIRQVLTEMNALPMPDRAWTELYVLAPEGWHEFEPEDLVMSDKALLGMIKGLGPDALLRFLQRRPVSDDPDLLIDKNAPDFVRMSNFILLHADKLLRPEDANALLDCQYVLRGSGTVNPAWAIGAALVQPARASEILHGAMAKLTKRDELYEEDAGGLAGALWRIRGPAELDFFVNWFYTAPPMLNDPDGQQIAFLWGVEAAARPDTEQLIVALVKDPRFDYTDWDCLKELLKIVNAGHATPLVSERYIYDAQPSGLLDDRMVLANWRNLLRREYGLPEEAPPAPEARPKQTLTQPAWSVPLASLPSEIFPSPDGKWLAMITNGTVAIFRADTGKFEWRIPRKPDAGVYCAAFRADGTRLIVFHQDGQFDARFSEWDLATRQQISDVLLAGKPTSGVSEGAYTLAGTRAVFAGYNDLVCFDAQGGKPLWVHPGEGGVHPPIALSADGTRLAVGGESEYPQMVKIYDALPGNPVRQFAQRASPVLALALARDGRKLATVSTADGLQLWDTTTGKLLKSYPYQMPAGPSSFLLAPAFSPDGRLLAVVGAEAQIDKGRIGVFRVDSAELEWEIRIKSDGAIGSKIPLAFAPDGKTLYIGGTRLEAWPLPNTP